MKNDAIHSPFASCTAIIFSLLVSFCVGVTNYLTKSINSFFTWHRRIWLVKLFYSLFVRRRQKRNGRLLRRLAIFRTRKKKEFYPLLKRIKPTHKGHEKKQVERKIKSKRKNFKQVRNVSLITGKERNKYFFPLLVQNRLVMEAFLDSGSESCIMSDHLFKLIPDYENIPDANTQHTLLDASKNVIPQARPPKLLTFTLGSKQVKHAVYILKQRNEFLVGACLMKHMSMNLLRKEHDPHMYLYTGNTNKLDNETKLYSRPTSSLDLTVDQHITLEAYKQKIVSCITNKFFNNQLCKPYVITTATPLESTPVQVLEGIYGITRGGNNLVIKNVSSHSISIPKGSLVAQATILARDTYLVSNQHIEEVTDCGTFKLDCKRVTTDLLEDEAFDHDVEPQGLPLPSDCQEVDYKKGIEESTSFPNDLKQTFLNFLENEVPGLCSKHEYDFGKLDLGCKFEIDLKTSTAHTSKPYRLNSVRQQQLDHAIEQLINAGILEKGDSPYTSPAFLIAKAADKQGICRTRICLLYTSPSPRDKRQSRMPSSA